MFYLKPMVEREKPMIDWKDLLPKWSSIVVWIVLLMVYLLVGCTVYPRITVGYDSCPRICGVEHRHKTHSVNYDCGQEVCIHMLTKDKNG